MKKEILRLTKFWYEYVSQDHHKDRDCHWHINEIWSYGREPTYSVEHYGYIADDLDSITCNTHEEAEQELIKMLKGVIQNEKEWAKSVLKNPKDWDEYQAKSAKMVSDFKL